MCCMHYMHLPVTLHACADKPIDGLISPRASPPPPPKCVFVRHYLLCCRLLFPPGSMTSPAGALRLAFHGCGLIAEHHLHAMVRASAACGISATVAAFVDIDPSRATRLAEMAGVRGVRGDDHPGRVTGCKGGRDCFATLDEALDARAVDAVLVMLPHHLHEEAAVTTMRRDKHLLLEKPMGCTLGQCVRILEEAESAAERTDGRHVFSVAENSSFWPEVVAASALLEAGAIGEVVTARAHYYEAMSNRIMDKDEAGGSAPKTATDWVDWRSSLARAGGGVCIDGGLHWLRPLREWLGEVEEVVAVAARPHQGLQGESLCHALLRFRSNVSASYQCTVLDHHATLGTREPFFRIIGRRGEITIDGEFSGGGMLFNAEHPRGQSIVGADNRGFIASYAPQMVDYLRAVAAGNPKALHRPPIHAYYDLLAIHAMYRSLETGRWERVLP